MYTIGFYKRKDVWCGLTFNLFLCVTVLNTAFEKMCLESEKNKTRSTDFLSARSLTRNLFLCDKKINGGFSCIG